MNNVIEIKRRRRLERLLFIQLILILLTCTNIYKYIVHTSTYRLWVVSSDKNFQPILHTVLCRMYISWVGNMNDICPILVHKMCFPLIALAVRLKMPTIYIIFYYLCSFASLHLLAWFYSHILLYTYTRTYSFMYLWLQWSSNLGMIQWSSKNRTGSSLGACMRCVVWCIRYSMHTSIQ